MNTEANAEMIERSRKKNRQPQTKVADFNIQNEVEQPQNVKLDKLQQMGEQMVANTQKQIKNLNSS